MAPEVFRHEAYDRTVDVYSFAVIVHEVGGERNQAGHWAERYMRVDNLCRSTCTPYTRRHLHWSASNWLVEIS